MQWAACTSQWPRAAVAVSGAVVACPTWFLQPTSGSVWQHTEQPGLTTPASIIPRHRGSNTYHKCHLPSSTPCSRKGHIWWGAGPVPCPGPCWSQDDGAGQWGEARSGLGRVWRCKEGEICSQPDSSTSGYSLSTSLLHLHGGAGRGRPRVGTCIVAVATVPWDGDMAARRGLCIFVLILTTCHMSLHGPTLLLAFKAAFKIKLMAALPKSTLTAVSLSAVWVLHPRSWTWASVHSFFCSPPATHMSGQQLGSFLLSACIWIPSVLSSSIRVCTAHRYQETSYGQNSPQTFSTSPTLLFPLHLCIPTHVFPLQHVTEAVKPGVKLAGIQV